MATKSAKSPAAAKGQDATIQTETIETAAGNGDAAPAAAAAFKGAGFKGYEEFLTFGKANVEAFVQSGNIVARGVQDLSKSFVTLAQQSIEQQMAASRALIGAKSLKEVMDVSSSLAKSNFEKMVSESNRITQISTKLAEEAFAPLTGRVNAAVERLTKTAA